jgi:NADPH-dependent 2,4-dienoyl-CoA reductase/sulfur reductase-like enzyme
MGGLVADLHHAHGTELITGAGVTGIDGDGSVSAVRLSDGRRLPADLVLVAIGSTPNTGWLDGSGLALADGVLCSAALLAAPDIVAAGDVANWWHRGYGRHLRIEHRMNATEQGQAAVRTLLGEPVPFTPVPYFWSDQYDVKLQVYGVPDASCDFEIVVGSPEDGRFAGVYRDRGRLVAGLAWNLPKQALALRTQVQRETANADVVTAPERNCEPGPSRRPGMEIDRA